MGPPNCPGHIPGRAPLRESQFGFRLNSRGSNISNSAVLPLLSYPGPALVVARCSIPWSCLHQLHKLAPTLPPQILPPIPAPRTTAKRQATAANLPAGCITVVIVGVRPRESARTARCSIGPPHTTHCVEMCRVPQQDLGRDSKHPCCRGHRWPSSIRPVRGREPSHW